MVRFHPDALNYWKMFVFGVHVETSKKLNLDFHKPVVIRNFVKSQNSHFCLKNIIVGYIIEIFEKKGRFEFMMMKFLWTAHCFQKLAPFELRVG